jgi:hypothetical protein
MSTPFHLTLRAALAAALLAAVPAAHAQMYRWLDANGSVTFSNQLPSDLSAVRDLTVVLENPSGALPNQQYAAEAPRASVVAPPASGELPPPGESRTSARVTAAPGLTEATRDPCLISADPKCIEKNKAAYVPGRGYSPGSVAVGSTSSASAGGAVGGGGPPKLTAPKASAYALPPGSEAPTSAKR